LLTGAGLERFTEFADGTLEIPGRDPRSGRLRQIILRACHPDAKQRFDSAAAMLSALDEAAGGRRRKYRVVAGVFVLVLLIVGGLLVLWKALSPGSENPDPEANGPGLTLPQEQEAQRIQQEVDRLQFEGKFAEAAEELEKKVKIHISAFGEKSEQVFGGQQDIKTSRRISLLPRDAQEELAKIFRLENYISKVGGEAPLTEVTADQRRVVEVQQKYITEPDQRVGRSMLYLGALLMAAKKYDEAEEWTTKSLDMLLRVSADKDNTDTTAARNNLAGCLAARGDFDGAEKEYRKVLETRLNMLTGRNPWTIISRIHLGKTLRKLGREDDAKKQYEQAGIDCTWLREEEYTADICIRLAEEREEQKHRVEAQDYLERALRIFVSKRGEESVAAAEVRLRLAANLVAQDKPEEANEHVTKALGFIIPRTLPLNATAGSMGSPMPCLAGLALLARIRRGGAP
jgi:tetratricopeptide (TPR) repeat protein